MSHRYHHILYLDFLVENCQDKEIRLVNDASSDSQPENEGRLEVCFENVWGAVYDTNWTGKDAAVACHQLGFSRYSKKIIIIIIIIIINSSSI